MNIWPSDTSEGICAGIKEAADRLLKDIEVLRRKADESTGKIMTVKSCSGIFGKRYSNIGDYGRTRTYSWLSSASLETTIERAKSEAERMWSEVQAIHDKNLPAIENNKSIIEKVKLIMSNIGIPDSHVERVKMTRKRDLQPIRRTSGYLNDLARHCVTDDGFNDAQRQYKMFLADIDAYAATESKKVEDQHRNDEMKADQEKSIRELAVLVNKYGLPYDCGWDDVLQFILSKDKYLRLAHYLCLNRGDWSDGYEYAKEGLTSFKVENEEDQSIHDEISGLISDWDGDGRVFRDCHWNYSVLYGKVVDGVLKKDYELASYRTNG